VVKRSHVLCALALGYCGTVSAAPVTALNNSVNALVPAMETLTNFTGNLADTTVSSSVSWNVETDVTTMMGSFDMAGVWNYSWRVMADPDPFIDAVFSVKNMSLSTQTFTINFGLGVSPVFTNGNMSGDLTAGFEDTSGDGSVTFSVDSWFGQINGADVMPLSTAAFAPVICSGTGCTGSFSTADGPLPYTGTVNDIGLALSFTLSAGDTASFDTRFEVAPVPVPAAVWLFGSGLLGLAGVARRKAA